jgi:GT2 family glycosyltransferase
MRITALLACHNRRELTLRCLDSLFSQERNPGLSIDAVVVDDGSSDGTTHAVEARFPDARVLRGGGELFWAGAMACGERAALAQSPDALLWLNDDVLLGPGALAELLRTLDAVPGPCIAIGAVRDPRSGALSYSGVRRSGVHPRRFSRVEPAGRPLSVDTFNGNVVLIPKDVAATVGPVDEHLVQGGADYDYGLRAREHGVLNLLAPGSVGTCARSTVPPAWLDPTLPARERIRVLLGPKGIPPRVRARYLRRHGGRLWPVFWLAPYLRALPVLLRPRRQSPTRP